MCIVVFLSSKSLREGLIVFCEMDAIGVQKIVGGLEKVIN